VALKFKLKTAPTFFPVQLSDLKRNLRIGVLDMDTDRDTLLQNLIYAAIDRAQTFTGRQFARATYNLFLDSFTYSPGIGTSQYSAYRNLYGDNNDDIEITLGPVIQINSINYYPEGASVMTTIDPSAYQLDNVELTGRLRFLQTFIADKERLNVINIDFDNGWSSADAIPQCIKDAIILFATDRYLNPGNSNAGKSVNISAAERLLLNYKVARY
jgi:uncharacterized phiE125 gp8 family phage protein